MSRPLRLEHPGAVWHVTARGNEKRDVFLDDFDRERWLGLLANVVALFTWRLHGYVMMGNHYHLIAETPLPTLSGGMRHLNGVYTQAFNRRHQRVGHLFQGRFKSILVEKESHLLELLRYVVLNPVRAGLVDAPGEWHWSSYRATAGEAPAPPWLETDWSLSQFGRNAVAAARRYREFVGEGRGLPRRPWTAVKGQIYLGSDRFVDDALGRAAQRSRDREIPRTQREAAPLSAEQLVPAVLDLLAMTDSELSRPRKRLRERTIVAYALRRFAGATGTALARVLGVSPWHASALARAGEKHWSGDVRLAATIERGLRTNANRKQQT